MKISVLCSSQNHPIYSYLKKWCFDKELKHTVELKQSKNDLSGGDLLFLISCSEIINSEIRDRYIKTLVIHASDLPEGRGWSPHIWQILEGKNDIVVTLLEAEDQVDSGAIWDQRHLNLEGHELYEEINAALFELELKLMDYAVDNFFKSGLRVQDTRKSTYYRRRKPEDSRIDPDKSISEQFDLLRVADFERFPAFFDLRGRRYLIKIIKDTK